MANVSKPKRESKKPTCKELVERDAMALAQLIYDIYQEKKLKEKKDGIS